MENEYNLTGDTLKQMAYHKNRPYLSYTSQAHKLSISIPACVALTLTPTLKHMLGFDVDNALVNDNNYYDCNC